MVAIIEAGRLFIAQPPLFKVKKGKAERYLMSEREMEEFLLAQWVESSSIKIPGKAQPLKEEALLEALKRALEFRTLFAKFARRGVPRAILDGLLRKKFKGTKRGVGDSEIAAAVREVAGEIEGWTAQLASGDNGDAALIQVTGPQPTAFSPDLLKSPDYAQLFECHGEIAALHKGPCTVVDADGKEVVTNTLDQLIEVVMNFAKDGVTLQRYKGLGEMNPEQLWETTMNPETRTLLKVTMDDAVGADEIFTILMGDAVEPRREFIEKNALDVVNLDI
jgi:DNA gyrase subunit B